jgi:hypothetical protein
MTRPAHNDEERCHCEPRSGEAIQPWNAFTQAQRGALSRLLRSARNDGRIKSVSPCLAQSALPYMAQATEKILKLLIGGARHCQQLKDFVRRLTRIIPRSIRVNPRKSADLSFLFA